MPVQPTYPGVYIEELPSGVRTITGVATSMTAFIGRARRGPVNEPVIINSFGDYSRRFGGLWVESTMSYAVQDFFQNGGAQAIIIRLYKDDTSTSLSATAAITIPSSGSSDDLVLQAKSPGAWGSKLSATVNHDTADPTSSGGSGSTSNFNLIISENGQVVEEYLNVSIDENDARYLPRILEQRSELLKVSKTGSVWNIPNALPDTGKVDAAGGEDGLDLTSSEYEGSESQKTGIYALEKADLFNLLCIPPATRHADTSSTVYGKAVAYCKKRRAMLIVDSPFAWGESATSAVSNATSGLSSLGVSGDDATNAALFFPRVKKADSERENQTDTFVPCGIIAGIMSKTDTNRGVWKAPAGIDAALSGVQGLQVNLTDNENGSLNPLGINCLRSFPVTGRVVWGARTLRGADQLASQWKYIPVRRTALYIEESLYRGTQWVVFEPNDESLWGQIRLNVGAFMHNLFRQGAFQGSSPKDAYLVKCDSETTTQNDIDRGIVNILVGFAPLKPAEFVIIKIQQLTGQD